MKKRLSISNCIRSFATTIVFGLLIFAWGGAPAMAQGVAPFCPASYAYNSATKKCETTQPAYCPSGTAYIGSGKCKWSTKQICPRNYFLGNSLDSNNKSVPTCIKWPLASGPSTTDFVCPQGFTKEGYGSMCVKIIPMACYRGFTLRTTDNVCVSQKPPSCPPGYSFNPQGNRCIVRPGTPQ